MAIPLLHLGLLVHDQRRSLRFYETYFGFDSAGARHYPDGTVIVRNTQASTWPCTQATPRVAPGLRAFRVPAPRCRRREGAAGQDGSRRGPDSGALG